MSGGEGGAGWSGINLGRSVQLLDWLDGGAPVPFSKALAWGPAGAAQSSPNHESEAWGNELARAALAGDAAGFKAAAGVCRSAYFPRDLPLPGESTKHVGLWAWETAACDAHTHQHLAGAMMARVGAHVSGDKEMLELTALLLKANMRLLGSIATPELVCWGCATRAHPPEKPMFFVGSAWLREMKGATQIPEFLGKNAKANLVDPAHVCVRAARILRKMGDDFGGAGAEPAGPVSLKYPFTVWRGPDRHLAVMAKPEGLKGKPEEVADWVEAPWGIVKGNVKVQASLVRCGFGWSAPPPSPKAGAKAISHIKAGGSH